MKNKGGMKNCIAFVLALISLILPSGIYVNAVDAAQRDLVEIRVEGSIEELDRQAILDRLNEIREEACREGMPNPVDGEPMRPENYVPLEWSYDLEKIAVLRAAESTILQDHVRPDGSECFSAAPEGVPFTMETLAWGFGSAAAAIEGWYSEKTAYVEETGTPAGHYIALINPENRFVGIADLRADWQRDACAGAFASHSAAGSGAVRPAGGVDSLQETAGSQGGAEGPSVTDAAGVTEEWSIPLLRSYLPAVIEKAVSVTAGRIYSAARPGK